jgi:hypothetical protein
MASKGMPGGDPDVGNDLFPPECQQGFSYFGFFVLPERAEYARQDDSCFWLCDPPARCCPLREIFCPDPSRLIRAMQP